MRLLNLFLVFAALALTSYHGIIKSENIESFEMNKDGDISVTQAAKLITENLENDDFLIIDVRTPAEFITGRIKNSILINFHSVDFKNRVKKLDKTKKILVYCKKGGRSAEAKSIMKNLKFDQVYNMLGGVTEWKARGFELVE